jgi:hypothetical protein
MSMSHTHDAQVGGCFGGGHLTASGAAGWLGLAAAPTFGLMAVWTAMLSGQSDMLCISLHGASPFNGMAFMYGLMSMFHAAPWLKLFSSLPAPAISCNATVSQNQPAATAGALGSTAGIFRNRDEGTRFGRGCAHPIVSAQPRHAAMR